MTIKQLRLAVLSAAALVITAAAFTPARADWYRGGVWHHGYGWHGGGGWRHGYYPPYRYGRWYPPPVIVAPPLIYAPPPPPVYYAPPPYRWVPAY